MAWPFVLNHLINYHFLKVCYFGKCVVLFDTKYFILYLYTVLYIVVYKYIAVSTHKGSGRFKIIGGFKGFQIFAWIRLTWPPHATLQKRLIKYYIQNLFNLNFYISLITYYNSVYLNLVTRSIFLLCKHSSNKILILIKNSWFHDKFAFLKIVIN